MPLQRDIWLYCELVHVLISLLARWRGAQLCCADATVVFKTYQTIINTFFVVSIFLLIHRCLYIYTVSNKKKSYLPPVWVSCIDRPGETRKRDQRTSIGEARSRLAVKYTRQATFVAQRRGNP